MYLCFCTEHISLDRTSSNFCIITDNRILCLKLNIIPLCITIKQHYIFTYLCACAWICMLAMVTLQGTENNMQKSHFSFYHVGPRYQTRIVSLGGKQLSSLRHLIGPNIYFLIYFIHLRTTKLISHLGCYE